MCLADTFNTKEGGGQNKVSFKLQPMCISWMKVNKVVKVHLIINDVLGHLFYHYRPPNSLLSIK
jgi:hypothetical protein